MRMLLLAIIINTVFASCYKIAVRKQCDLQVVNAWVYVGSTAIVLLYALLIGNLELNSKAILLGMAGGVMSFLATLTFFLHIRRGQLTSSWTVISLSLSIPVLASIFAWHERPSAKQTVGLLLIAVSLILFGRSEIRSRGKVK